MLICAIFLTAVSAGSHCELKKPLAGLLGKKKVVIPLGEVIEVTQADKIKATVTAKLGSVKVMAKTLRQQCVPVTAAVLPSPAVVAITPPPTPIAPVAKPPASAPVVMQQAEPPRKIHWVEDDQPRAAMVSSISPGRQKQRDIAYGLAAGGLALIGGGIATYVVGARMADALIARSDNYRGNPLRTRAAADALDADRRVIVVMDALTYTFIGLGVAGIGAGIAFFVLSTHGDDTSVAVVPGAGSLHLVGRF